MSRTLAAASAGRPVVIIGVGGMLWRAWAAALDRAGIAHLDPPLDHLDLTRPQSLAFIGPTCPLVINCAAWTDVDGAEANPGLAMDVNAHGAGHLARRCAEVGATLLHYSTDYVFGGDATAPCAVDAPRRPLGAYARSKALGEELIEASGCDLLMIRTSWLYAPWGKNFVRTIHALSQTREMLRVVDDQRGRPTSAEHLAAASLRLLEQDARGTFHITDGGECTWFEFASEIVRLSGSSCRIIPCTTADFPRPARRPAYSVLDLSRTEALLGPMPDWRWNLAQVMRRLDAAIAVP
jgi:dTDP-4-dehydrorhamnose reductase